MSDERFVFDFNRITYREVQELDLKQGNDDGNQEAADDTLDLIVRVLVKWPFEAEFSVDAAKDLGLQDFADLQTAFTSAMNGVFKSGD